MGLKYTDNVTKGKCTRCRAVWYWPTGERKLRDTRCPVCNAGLLPTTHQMKKFEWRKYPK